MERALKLLTSSLQDLLPRPRQGEEDPETSGFGLLSRLQQRRRNCAPALRIDAPQLRIDAPQVKVSEVELDLDRQALERVTRLSRILNRFSEVWAAGLRFCPLCRPQRSVDREMQEWAGTDQR